MRVSTFAQPQKQLGPQLQRLLLDSSDYSRIVFVSAFTALKTILRFRERLLTAADAGASVRFVLGIDLRGTSVDVLRELAQWNCETFLYHNPIARATFHPKLYLFERDSSASLFVGSNNLTDGGLYTNYEATTHYSFNFPDDNNVFLEVLEPLRCFIEPAGSTVLRLDAQLIQVLEQRGLLPLEVHARRGSLANQRPSNQAQDIPPNPFLPTQTPWPPLLPKAARSGLASMPNRPRTEAAEVPEGSSVSSRPSGILVWRKHLSASDALQVRPGSHHVGGVRLTQAQFESSPGQKINQTKYFRELFDEYGWEQEPGKYTDQEHTFVPIRVIVRGRDYGIKNFEISHKPSGEAGQANYTTILRWGRNFTAEVERLKLAGAVFSLYETPDTDAGFLMEIEDS